MDFLKFLDGSTPSKFQRHSFETPNYEKMQKKTEFLRFPDGGTPLKNRLSNFNLSLFYKLSITDTVRCLLRVAKEREILVREKVKLVWSFGVWPVAGKAAGKS